MSFLFSLPSTTERSTEDEIMEESGVTQSDFVRALREIRWVNQYLGGTAAILESLKELSRQQNVQEAIRILDIGTGSADIPMALAAWGRFTGQRLEITAVDIHPLAVEEAQKRTQGYPEITIEQGDALQLPYLPQSFDFVISSMFLHHLNNAEAVRLLKVMAGLARLGIIVNDLERHKLAWLGIRIVGVLTGKGHVFRNDSALSVLRGFQKSELATLCHQAGLENFQIHHRHPFRWLLLWQRSNTMNS